MFDTSQPAYDRLRKIYAEKTKQIVAWTGAGLSVAADLPTWASLRNRLCEVAEKTAIHQDATAQKRTIALKTLGETETDLWLAFEHLKNALGSATFRAEIKEAFVPAGSAKIPRIYSLLWQLGIRGILNLNLDGLASRASGEVFLGKKRVVEFTGKNAAGHGQSIHTGGAPFIGNLHGVIEDENSWVFTKSQLTELFESRGYLDFVATLAQTRALIFIGVSADDVSAGGQLARLNERGVSLSDHFWITHRNDRKTIEWAESAGLRIIYYEVTSGGHGDLLQALEGLSTYASKDEIPPPVIPSKAGPVMALLPTPDDLERESPERIRLVLNSAAVHILSKGNDTAVEEYNTFWEKYSESIYRAWSVNTNAKNSVLFGHQIEGEHAHGAFGRVFRAKSPSGQLVAIKILHGDVRTDRAMLDSFRRGVRSMQILSQRTIEGIVPYRLAWEIPACAVMDFIDGPNLEEAVEAGYIEDWPDIISISLQLARIIERAHLLPERVLHRDVRPANVMLKDYYANTSKLRVVVLDFDLSWHQGAVGQSIDWSKSISGFVAPELTVDARRGLTRSALVDSFGIGMTFFFVASGQKPLYLQHQHGNWLDILKEKIVKRGCKQWRSLPVRFARLIDCATRNKQTERWDMTRIRGELERLQLAMKNPEIIQSAEMLAEEVSCRCDLIASAYEWDVDRNESRTILRSHVRIVGNETTRRVELKINWTNMGQDAYRNIAKYVMKARDQSYSKLKKAGWRVESAKLDVIDAGIEASYAVPELKTRLDEASSAANDAVKLFQFQ